MVFGTNLTESALGTALAIAGNKALHIDFNDRYGGMLSNFNLKDFVKFISRYPDEKETSPFLKGFQLRGFKALDELSLNEEEMEKVYR